MVAVLLLTHEDFGKAMLKSAELVLGSVERVKTLGLHRGDDITEFCGKVKKEIEELNQNDGVLVFADLFGASPYNAAAIASSNVEAPYKCITGLSFPMLLEAITMRNSYDLEELTKHCMQSGKDGIKELFAELASTKD
ncbi:PTS sugar transporter subunit IIA [Pectinatus cerevisiiphilus]|uniref:PTS system mannose-specific IIA component n=1 Tax=Pectinatus cerevisiiphilus TaxID=86956 RepID=A0A4R3KAG9_9FIRM|nr:PTS mannose transporter subunit IIAB [Pectinatus cerevisiiphilus]TCS79970.1 PTS system mannose-specific IIA component [Pectinatus cerevisiiphilus]